MSDRHSHRSIVATSALVALLASACAIRSEHYGADTGNDVSASDDVYTPPSDGNPPPDVAPVIDVPLVPDTSMPDVQIIVPDTSVPDTSGDPCAAFTDCSMCTPHSGCGWCSGDSHCYSGTASGSGATACGGTNWAYYGSECTDPASRCSRYNSCDSCAAVAGCGWCGTSSSCLAGTASGPTGATCGISEATWSYTRGMCSSPSPCASHTDCSSCATAAGCGWCNNRGACFSGNATSATDGECGGDTWVWTSGACR